MKLPLDIAKKRIFKRLLDENRITREEYWILMGVKKERNHFQEFLSQNKGIVIFWIILTLDLSAYFAFKEKDNKESWNALPGSGFVWMFKKFNHTK
jgi:hypothetical protein